MLRDKRMLFLKNEDFVEKEDSNDKILEYKVFADANIVGTFNDKTYGIDLWEFGEFKKGEKRKLILKIQDGIPKNERFFDNANPKGFYHGGNIADEIISLFSLFLRRRLTLGTIVRINNRPITYSKKPFGWIDKEIISGKVNLNELSEWIELVKNLKAELHQKFILATRLYHNALIEIESNPDIAYLNLISAIESLCKDHPIDTVLLNDIHPDVDALINRIGNKTLEAELREAILKKERFIGRRFVNFIIDYIEPNFWMLNRPKFGRITKNDLERLLKKIYKQRSNTLHEGIPFQPQIFSPPLLNSEIAFSISVIKGEKRWDNKDFIPNVHFFERLVNHVLKNFLEKNQYSFWDIFN